MPATIAHANANCNSARFKSARYPVDVNIRDVRLERLRELLAEHNNVVKDLARTLKKAPAQVSQWLNGHRTITEDSARDIERAARRPHGWLDLETSGALRIDHKAAEPPRLYSDWPFRNVDRDSVARLPADKIAALEASMLAMGAEPASSKTALAA